MNSKVDPRQLLDMLNDSEKSLIIAHDYPDPDSLSSAMGLQELAKEQLNKDIDMVYSGVISREENLRMLHLCEIKISHSSTVDFDDYDKLILCDSQPSAGNVSLPAGKLVDAVVDHHMLRKPSLSIPYLDIRVEYGSTSTITTEYLKDMGHSPSANLATALYYGIKTDTIGFAKKAEKVNYEAMKYLYQFLDQEKLFSMEYVEKSRQNLETVSKSVANAEYIKEKVVFCDCHAQASSELVAEVADTLAKVGGLECIFVIGQLEGMSYFSIRCKNSIYPASQLAHEISAELGTGGGNINTGGGQLFHKGGKDSEQEHQRIANIIKERLSNIFTYFV